MVVLSQPINFPVRHNDSGIQEAVVYTPKSICRVFNVLLTFMM
jgi:hypothetical protein